MRVLLVHNRYLQRGGEDTAFENDCELLQSAGLLAEALTFDNASIASRGLWGTALDTVWSRDGAERVLLAAERTRADLVHFHNTFPLVSPAAYRVLRRTGRPVIQSLHNFRPICANATLFRDERVCVDCLDRTVAFDAIMHACYRGSRAATAAVVAMQVTHRFLRTWQSDVSAYAAVSEFTKRQFVRAGFEPQRIQVLRNFVNPPVEAATGRLRGDEFVFFGRLSPEKGLATLLEAWNTDERMPPLVVIGDGPLGPIVDAVAATNRSIARHPRMEKPELFESLGRARAVIVPSTGPETSGLAVIEAFAASTPVIGSRIGALPEAVIDRRTGLLVPPGDAKALRDAVQWMSANAADATEFGRAGRTLFETEYSVETALARRVELYRAVLAEGG